jgi:decaprenylphospho-beta-D-erythro-pentofuranosid-2-ulose 2-reductase
MNDAMGMPQTAVVLGGSSEIARAVMRALVPHRLRRVVLAGRDKERLRSPAAELEALGTDVEQVLFDITDTSGHEAVAADASRRLGEIDLVLLAAGVLGDQEADESDPQAVAGVFQTNCTGAASAMTAFASVLCAQGQGRMVVLSSVAAVRVRRANYVYGASKAGLDAFAQGMAAAMEGSGASLMVVRPGWVATAMTEGRKPAPLATTPQAVAADVVKGLQRGSAVVWSPAVLKWFFAVGRLLPTPVWRRLPG